MIFGPERAREVHHYIEVDECALAMEAIADLLGYVRGAITDRDRDDMLALARFRSARRGMAELSFVRLAAAGGDNFRLSARPVVNDLLA